MKSQDGLTEFEADIRNRVYQFIIERSKLSARHTTNLRERGFPENQIRGGPGYFTLPSDDFGGKLLAGEVLEKFGEDIIEQIPGFYKEDAQWSLAAFGGTAIPVRDIHRNIVALKIRADNPDESRNRYTYLSSSKKQNGIGSGSHVHVPAVGPDISQCDVVRITEGEIKADLATLKTGILTVSIPGVSSWKKVLPVLKSIKPSKVLISFDADAKEKAGVAGCLKSLFDSIKTDYEVAIEVWNIDDGKGIDDLLAKGKQPTALWGEARQEYLDSLPVATPEQQPSTPSPLYTSEGGDSKPSSAEVSLLYLKGKNYYSSETQLLFRSWSGKSFEYDSGSYQEISKDKLEASVMSFLQTQLEDDGLATGRFRSDVIENIKARTFLDLTVTPPMFIGVKPSEQTRFISMSNGILKLDYSSGKMQMELMPHTPDFFSLNVMPYDYDPSATCPTFGKFLSEIQPDPEVRDFLQEWFGYNLVAMTKFEKFCIFYGDGANGKSVLIKVLVEMLGLPNVSSVGLEAFSSQNTVPLGSTFGKLANVIEELDQVDRAAEGLIKNFVSGGLMDVNRKYKDHLQFYPTARITLATNILPRFSDRSDGLSRRMILIPFKVRILDEAKQDKRLKESQFWRDSGELAGVFNWALTGLQRLLERGRFVEPDVCRLEREEFKMDSNPGKSFLTENLIADPGGIISGKRLFQEFEAYCKTTGQRPFRSSELTAEVKRVFPQAVHSKNAVHVGDVLDEKNGGCKDARSRVWRGIRFTHPAREGEVEWTAERTPFNPELRLA